MCYTPISTVLEIITAKGNGIIRIMWDRDKYICQGLTCTEVERKQKSLTIEYDCLFRRFI